MALMIQTTSSQLLKTMRGGCDERAWRRFFATYAPMLLAFAKRLGLSDADAHDALQETVLAVFAAFAKMQDPFDRSKGRFKAWLRGIAKHKIADVQRRRVRQEFVKASQMQEATDPACMTSEMDEHFETEWRRNLLTRALDQVAATVDPTVYQAFELYVLQGHRPDQVARLLGVTRNAVYISKTRVMRRLRGIFSGLLEEES